MISLQASIDREKQDFELVSGGLKQLTPYLERLAVVAHDHDQPIGRHHRRYRRQLVSVGDRNGRLCLEVTQRLFALDHRKTFVEVIFVTPSDSRTLVSWTWAYEYADRQNLPKNDLVMMRRLAFWIEKFVKQSVIAIERECR